MKFVANVVWREVQQAPTRIPLLSYKLEGGFLVVELPDNLLPPGIKSRTVLFPADTIQSVEVTASEKELSAGYREDSTFREQIGKSPWMKAMGHSREKD